MISYKKTLHKRNNAQIDKELIFLKVLKFYFSRGGKLVHKNFCILIYILLYALININFKYNGKFHKIFMYKFHAPWFFYFWWHSVWEHHLNYGLSTLCI